ncbi:ferritin-like domain-containing protein, partial [Shewanella sp. A3A]|nr:ferritin-like domain-containing protein [Shewanella ferrihydritica]
IEAMTISSTKDIFFDQLSDLCSAAAQAAESKPDLFARSTQASLCELLEDHRSALGRSLVKISGIFRAESVGPGGATC